MSKSDIQYPGDHSPREKYSRAAEGSMGLGEYVFAILKVPSKGGFTERVAFE